MSIDVTRTGRSFSELVADEIRVAMVRKRKSGAALARDLGVSPAWVSYRLTGSQEIGLNDLDRIARALGVSITSLLPPLKGATVTAEYTSTPMVTPDLPVQRVASTPVPELAGRFASASLPRPAGRMRTAPTGY